MMRKILLKSQSYWQLLIALIGAFAGILVLLATVQFYSDLNSTLLKRDDLLGADYLVVQKKISTLSTLSLSSTNFSEEEIKDFSEQKFVEQIGVFKSGRFKVFAAISGFEKSADLLTEAFFESIPKEFIDVKSDDWNWNVTSEQVPVILPSAYLDAFNFGFGPAQGLPPLSEKAFKMLKLKIVIAAANEKIILSGKIIGFSDRINTILVPEEFLEFSNQNYATKAEIPSARLIVAVKDINDPRLAKYIDDNGYDTNADDLKGSRVKTVLMIILSVLLILGLIIVGISILSIMQYAQVIISRVQYELKILMLMGYSHLKICAKYILYFSTYFFVLILGAHFLILLLKSKFNEILQDYGFKPDPNIHINVYYAGFIMLIFFVLVNSIGVYLQMRHLAKNLQ